MRPSTSIVTSAAALAALDTAATVEAIRAGQPWLAAVTALAAATATAVAAIARRPSVRLRGDHAAWVARTAAATGEDESAVLARAVAAHRQMFERGVDV